MMMAATALDPRVVQRENARLRANAVRTARAEVKRAIKAGRLDPRDVILNPTPVAEGMEVMDILVAIPRVGKAVAGEVLRGACRRDLLLGQMGDVTRGLIVERMQKRIWFALPRDA
jgi:hypothetical protein